MKLGRYLRIHGLSQTKFAAKLSVLRTTVNYWVNERNIPLPRHMTAIERATEGKVSADDFNQRPRKVR